jgi:hypothetical protein
MNPAIEFLCSKLGLNPRVRGSQIRFQNVRARYAKLELHKFLRERRLKGYRVIVVHPGLVEVLGPRKGKPSIPLKQNRTAPMTIPEYWTAAALGGTVPQPGRKWKQSR